MTVSLSSFDNDAVIISAGGILPTAFLKEIGIIRGDQIWRRISQKI